MRLNVEIGFNCAPNPLKEVKQIKQKRSFSLKIQFRTLRGVVEKFTAVRFVKIRGLN